MTPDDREALTRVILNATVPFRGAGGQTVPYVMPVHYAIADAALAWFAAQEGERVETVEALDALPVGSVVLDSMGDAAILDERGWQYAETALMSSKRAVRYGPFRVLYRPDVAGGGA